MALTAVLGACGDDGATSGSRDDGGMSASALRDGATRGDGGDTDGTRGDGATPGTASPPATGDSPTTCGGTPCPDLAPELAALGAAACCTERQRCGIETPFSPGLCLSPAAPGGADPSCPVFAIDGLATWAGCCTPQGECGALDTEGGLGCVANGGLGAPALSCTYDPDNTCERILEVRCDGAEDCSGGRMCCGHYDGAGYRIFRCATSCVDREANTGDVWSQACHPDDTCETNGFECRTNPGYLPNSLYRCRDSGYAPATAGSTAAGEVNCGSAVCGASEKCCVSFPGLVSHCVPSEDPCRCDLVPLPADDAGADDAG